jgi:M6 family metalloprotease-like protein
LNLGSGSTLGWYNAGSRSAIAETDAGREALIKNAINQFNAVGHDFSQYDNDGDGYIDYFAVVWTGPHGPWASFWWAYQTGFSDSSYSVDGKKLGTYSWQWENGSYPSGSFNPHTLIHETGHALGLPDYYDYDDTVGPKGGVGGLDMMDANWGDHNAFSKFVLDWLNPTVISTAGTYPKTLASSASTADALLIMPNASGLPFEEFFMVQHRKREKNDAKIPTDGLLIWHVDAALTSKTWGDDYLYNNSDTQHKLLRLMEADGLEEIEQNKWANAGDFYTPGKSFTPTATPNSNAYSGLPSAVQVTDIAAAGNAITCNAGLVVQQLMVTKNGIGTVTSSPAGIDCGGTCSSSFLLGQNVTLTAAPNSGSNFAWSGACKGIGACVVTMNDNKSIVANFYADSDNDSIADDWEMQYFGNLTTANATSDFDKDGYSDRQEYLNFVAGEKDSAGADYDPTKKNAPPGGNWLPIVNKLLLRKK